jgi:uncharacterized protein YndB with AHSA1/START domain
MSDKHIMQVDLDIDAPPEAVWDALATSAGTAAWSFRVDAEPREGGTVRLDRGPFAEDDTGIVTAWEPPHRFGYEGGPIAVEFLVEARDQGSCALRVVNTFPGGTEWDVIAEEAGNGWRMSLILLRAYVTNFAGQPWAPLDFKQPVSAPPEAREEVGARFAEALGVRGGEFSNALASGVVEHLDPTYVLLRATTPCPGLFAISSFPMDVTTLSVNMTGRLYGPDAEAVAAREHPRWQEWLTSLNTQ